MAEKSKTPARDTTSDESKSAVAAPRALSPFEEMERLFGSFMEGGWMDPLRRERALSERLGLSGVRPPRVDVVDGDEEIRVRAEIPGVQAKDLDVSVTEGAVTIKGETATESEDTEGDYYRQEISRGAFARTVPLPAAVNADKAKASFKDGILELKLPKVNASRRRRIKID
ncbi:Hsp20/alpha crystallin family protein [Spiribacter halobius]|uniref:Heat-shock protein Hsp20 n=1 Tax=Sediminicurvatus halobius TaxID=2182432 RepID=A0A2U2N2T3_9GAMM|nr:Hsp20/alpha crystallin family protein [Spiribacter halobius]PWG63338.1 heat-shock protein Hsp20 [Spiribacter halobius]UEX79183.1 Hsp20/alpha crystallin family protein [Spiribacter halobius]